MGRRKRANETWKEREGDKKEGRGDEGGREGKGHSYPHSHITQSLSSHWSPVNTELSPALGSGSKGREESLERRRNQSLIHP